MSPLELAPYARASLRQGRVTQLAIAAILGALGGLVLAILTAVTIAGAAGPDDGIPIIALITALVTLLPMALLLWKGLPHESRHVLVRVLEQHPEKVRSVSFSYQQTPTGALRVASVLLTDRTTWSFPVPDEEQLARAPRRVARAGRAMTSFTGDFVPLPTAWTGLEGPGTIEVTEAALVIGGRRARTTIATVIAVLLASSGGFGGLLFFVWADFEWMDDPRLPAVLVIALAVGLYVGAKELLVRALPRAQLRLAIPWAHVQDVRLAGAVVDVQTIDPGLVGLSRFRTDRAEVLVQQCRS